MTLEQKIKKLQGPILILGGSGFVGANLLRAILRYRTDVFGTTTQMPFWRLEDLPEKHIITTDLLVETNLEALLADVQPRTIFNCVAYGAYSFETDAQLVYRTNFNFTAALLERLKALNISSYVHAGSSSEYGYASAGPDEAKLPEPNSPYAVSKVAAANLIYLMGKKHGLPCANLRLYSIYGPLEDSSRLIPNIVSHGLDGRYPVLVNPEVSRDFVYIDDIVEAFIDTARNLKEENYGESFNIGYGHKTTIREAAGIAKEVFGISAEPEFGSMPERDWDEHDWYADNKKAEERLGWKPRTDFKKGLALTTKWYESIEDKDAYHRSSKKFGLDTDRSISAIIACYKDNQAIPIMYERLKATFTKLNIDYEIIFVNDNSPDDSEEVIRSISRKDRKVIGISHSRNFGSQAAFRSGMEVATKNACVLLDGDLQDPPELIEQFVEKWRAGYDVVFGRRVKREASFFMQWAPKAFYRVFDYFSYIPIPHDAGDFSLIDKKVVHFMLTCPERDLFLRGVRAFVGFRQVGVDYIRPERRFGTSTNSLFKNMGWAKKGLFSYSNTPLNILSFVGVTLFILSLSLSAIQILSRIFFPDLAPRGLTTVIIIVLFFGSLNILGLSIIGEYIGKIFEEVKARPRFIRRSIIKNGEVRPAAHGSEPQDL